jgi:GNAT superfamily N-acetyltransferase
MGSCPVLRFTREEKRVGKHLYGVRVEALAKGVKGRVGAITVANRSSEPDVAFVSHILVDEAFHRCGVGTRLYERAAQIACKDFKLPLSSDSERSGYAQGFWEKQVRKGRATCVKAVPERRSNCASDALVGRGGCERYKLTCPAPKSLAQAGVNAASPGSRRRSNPQRHRRRTRAPS